MTEKAPQMVPVPISEFVSGATVPVDLFVKLGEDKFILVAKKDSKTARDQLETYESKAVFYIWVKKGDYSTLVKSNLTIAGIIVRHESLDTKQKTHVLTNAAGQVFRQLDEMGINMEAYAQAKQIVDATICLAEGHKDLSELFAALSDVSDHLLKHSMAVCAVSTLIAQTMKWDSRATIEKIALGALLHDIGKKALPADLLNKPKAKMTHEETQIYESHTFKGMQMLLGLGIVPDDVIAIVYEHHENALGMGFPRKLRNLKMHPLARIVALANEFVDLVMANPNCAAPKTPREALITIETTMGQPFAKDVFKALTHVVTKAYLEGAA
ncbi:MAG: HD domain-containing phosphohydrolase [Bdellovibrionota bacterium]